MIRLWRCGTVRDMGTTRTTEVQFGPEVAVVVVDARNDFTDRDGSLYGERDLTELTERGVSVGAGPR